MPKRYISLSLYGTHSVFNLHVFAAKVILNEMLHAGHTNVKTLLTFHCVCCVLKWRRPSFASEEQHIPFGTGMSVIW